MSTAIATAAGSFEPAPTVPPRPFRPQLAVLCAVEPALASFEAARQAATLAGGGPLVLAAPALPEDRSADTHLTAARFIAARAGADAAEVRLGGDDAVGDLLAMTEAYDVLVVVDRRDNGAPGRLAEIAVRRAACPVLVARRLPHGRVLGDAIAVVPGDRVLGAARCADPTLLVVPDADPELAARIARRAPCSVLVSRTASRADAPTDALVPLTASLT